MALDQIVQAIWQVMRGEKQDQALQAFDRMGATTRYTIVNTRVPDRVLQSLDHYLQWYRGQLTDTPCPPLGEPQ